MLNLILLCGIALSCQLYQLQNKESVRLGLAEYCQGLTGLPFVGMHKTDNSEINGALLSFIINKAMLKPMIDESLIFKGYARIIKKFAIQHLQVDKKSFNTVINYSKTVLGIGASLYFFSSTIKHNYAYCGGSLLFALNGFTHGKLEEKMYFSLIKGIVKTL